MKLLKYFMPFVLSGCFIGDEIPPDQTIWEYDLPGNNALNQQYLLGIDQSIKSENFKFIEGVIIIKNDNLVYENYYLSGNNRYQAKNLSSAGLSFTLAAVGIAVDKGLLSIEDAIASYLPEYASLLTTDENKSGITIRNLLTHRTGIAWNESLTFIDPNDDLSLMKASDNWIKFVLEQPSEAAPGFRYSFNTANGVLLARIIENASGMDFQAFLKENLLDPLTISSLSIEETPEGSYNGGDGYNISLIDWVKLGYLYLNEGIWEGRRIIDPNFIAETKSVQYAIQANPSLGPNYENIGYIFGLFGDPSTNRFGVDETDIFYSYGKSGQSIFMIPSQDMVVGILANNYFGFNILSLNLLAEITFTTDSD